MKQKLNLKSLCYFNEKNIFFFCAHFIGSESEFCVDWFAWDCQRYAAFGRWIGALIGATNSLDFI